MSWIIRNLSDFPLDRHSCQLLGPTALVVQALMGILAVLSLVYKRHRETHKRPWKIWLFDVSKQVFGAMFVHGLNVLISDLGSHHSAGNACTYYFLNILLDTTLGVGLIYLGLQSATWFFSKQLGIKGLKTGQYGNPPSVAFWVRQTAVYVLSITTMKLLVVALFAFWPDISTIGDWLLGWTTIGDGDSVQVVFVMGIFPVVMNVLQFWLIDSIVKASTNPTDVPFASPRNPGSEDYEPLFNTPDDDDDAAPRDIEAIPQSSTSRTTSNGDIKTLASIENDKGRFSVTGSPSPMTLQKTSVATHDYPPNVGSVSPRSSTRPRHKYEHSPPLLGAAVVYSAPAVSLLNPTRDLSHRSVPPNSIIDGGGTALGDGAWEKNGWEERGSGERRNGRPFKQNRIHTAAR